MSTPAKLLPPPPPPVAAKPKNPGHATRFDGSMKPKTLVRDYRELLDSYDSYEAEAVAEGTPVNLYAFVAYAQRQFGIDNRWWGRHSRRDKCATKDPELLAAVSCIEARIAGHLATGGLQGKVHGGMASQMLKTMDDRDTLTAEKEAAEKLAELGQVPQHQVANIIHPECSYEQLAAIQAQGFEPLLWTQAQLEAGVPDLLPVGFVDDAG